MTCSPKRKNKFSEFLKILRVKYSIKQVEIAESISKTRQQVWHIFNGQTLFTAEQFKITLRLLQRKGAGNDELALLKRLFMEAKAGIELKEIKLGGIAVDPLIQIIAENLNYLDSYELIKIHRKIERYKFNHLRETNEELAAS